jgi:ZIP family zinc transporter
MSLAQIIFLGAIAGFTIYLGLPAGRIKGMNKKLRTFLSMSSTGILLFLFYDIFKQLSDPVETMLKTRDIAHFLILLAIFVVGFAGGLIGLISFEQKFLQSTIVSDKTSLPTRLSLMISAGIGLHNFSEGLAIGQSAGKGQIGFAVLLIVGFGLHNATEGFGIVGPLMGQGQPSWKFLGLAGLIGGGPTFLGTIVGTFFVSDAMSVLFLALAAGALIYILGELFHLQQPSGTRFSSGWGILAGFLFAFMTDLLLTFAGI